MRILAAALALTLASPALTAQGRANLTVTGGPITFAAPAVTDFTAGYIDAPAPIVYTVAGQGARNNHTPHTTVISVHSTTATLNGTTPVSTLTWRRSDLSTWNLLSTSDVTVETRPFVRNTTNDPWSNSLLFRLNLTWAGDPPGAYTTSVIVTLTATTP